MTKNKVNCQFLENNSMRLIRGGGNDYFLSKVEHSSESSCDSSDDEMTKSDTVFTIY